MRIKPFSLRVTPRCLLILLLALVLASCQSAPPVLRGTVLDDVEGSALTQAIVRASSAGAVEVPVDEQGRFELPLGVGEHEVVVSAPGYVSSAFEAVLTKGTLAQEREVRLARRQLAGVVTDDATGEPVEAAHVVYDGATGGGAEADTDADGRFAFEALRDASLSVAAVGYLPQTVPPEEVAAVFDASGQLAQPLAVALSPRVLRGRIVEADSGAPVAAAEVTAGEQRTQAADNGGFELAYIEPGTSVSCASAEHRPAEAVVYQGEEEIELALEPWQVRLTLSDAATQEPLAGAQITAGEAVSTTSDVSGQAELRVQPGTTLQVRHDGYQSLETVYEGERELTLKLAYARLSGVLREVGTGQPITNAVVLAYAVDDPLAAEGLEPTAPITMTAVDAEGRFAFDEALDVASLLVKAPGYARVIQTVDRVGAVEIELEPHEVRAIYITFGVLTLPERIEELLDLVESTSLNGIVVDVKGDRSYIAWDSPLPLAREIDAYHQRDLMDLREVVRACHERGIYAIARMVMFKDELLATERPEWAVKRESGEFYEDLEGLHWVDPFRAEVRAYNIALAREVAAMGFDEIQLDYLRFPSDGSVKGLVYSEEATFETRTAAMGEFCAQMADAIRPTPAFLAADIFGLTPWVDPGRDMGIGQRVDDIAPHMDYLSPMLYPSTFGRGNLGFDNPGLYPYEVVYHSILATKERTNTLVRPWLQHYSLYGVDYNQTRLLLQRRAAEDAGSHGWIYWNSRARYDPEVMAEGAGALVQPPPIEE